MRIDRLGVVGVGGNEGGMARAFHDRTGQANTCTS